MIAGVGVDLVEVARLQEMLTEHPRMADRLFTPTEIAYCESKRHKYLHYAGRFAAKESIIKTFGRAVPWKDMEIINDTHGRPEVRVQGKARELLGEGRLYISITHTHTYAVAQAVLEIDCKAE